MMKVSLNYKVKKLLLKIFFQNLWKVLLLRSSEASVLIFLLFPNWKNQLLLLVEKMDDEQDEINENNDDNDTKEDEDEKIVGGNEATVII